MSKTMNVEQYLNWLDNGGAWALTQPTPPAAYYDRHGDMLCPGDQVTILKGELKGYSADFVGGGWGDGSGMVWLDVWGLGEVSVSCYAVELAEYPTENYGRAN